MAPAVSISWTTYAWENYPYWQGADEAILAKINDLLKECLRTPFTGRGKPEPLRGDRKGFWSRRITQEHRLVYKLSGDTLYIAQCRYHYDDKWPPRPRRAPAPAAPGDTGAAIIV